MAEDQEKLSPPQGEPSDKNGGEGDPGAMAPTHLFTPQKSANVSDVVLAASESVRPGASDAALAESNTVAAPSFRLPAQPAAREDPPAAPAPAGPPDREHREERSQRPMALLPGAKVDDFEIVRLLGRGAFGHVYLARQTSLDRLVALKISANRGSEGRTMARLEHQHIVQVFSEKVEPDFNQRLLCMQLVPGIGLEKLIGMLHAARARGETDRPVEWNGGELLAIIDRSAALPAALDPSALHDREALARMDSVEATAWFGGRLAEALDFAHRHGVLHRDIKPANILVNPYGRPLLADFNISSQPLGSEPGGEEMFGGTFVYMAPEHLDAFNPTDPTGQDAVTARSDLFSLGLVLQQLLEGQMTFSIPPRKEKENVLNTLRTMANERRRARPDCTPGAPGARQTLQRTIHRCLAPKPDDRFASGAELAEQLDGCWRLRAAELQLPHVPRVLAPTVRRPFLWLALLVVLPQLAGSVVNIAYNSTQIVGKLTEPQQALFVQLVIGYNAIVYPLALVLFVLAVRPVWQCWRALENAEPLADGQVKAARQRALRLPGWIAALTAGGWFPGGVLFPLVIWLVTRRLQFGLGLHFFVSFYLSGLIALAYSLCGAQFIVLRVLYPGMWRDVRSFGAKARDELAPMSRRFGYMQFLAGSIPLLAALLLLALVGTETNSTFRWLVFGLIVLGGVGFQVASTVIRGLSEVVVTLTGTKA